MVLLHRHCCAVRWVLRPAGSRRGLCIWPGHWDQPGWGQSHATFYKISSALWEYLTLMCLRGFKNPYCLMSIKYGLDLLRVKKTTTCIHIQTCILLSRCPSEEPVLRLHVGSVLLSSWSPTLTGPSLPTWPTQCLRSGLLPRRTTGPWRLKSVGTSSWLMTKPDPFFLHYMDMEFYEGTHLYLS